MPSTRERTTHFYGSVCSRNGEHTPFKLHNKHITSQHNATCIIRTCLKKRYNLIDSNIGKPQATVSNIQTIFKTRLLNTTEVPLESWRQSKVVGISDGSCATIHCVTSFLWEIQGLHNNDVLKATVINVSCYVNVFNKIETGG